jgi:RNA polymerase sporulation-specific sigma factor
MDLEAHIPLVEKIARQHVGVLEFNDLVSEGILGTAAAGEAFDASGSASFETFAGYRIKGRMLDAIRKERGRGICSRPVDCEPLDEVKVSPPEDGVEKEELWMAVKRLSEKQRRVITSHYVDQRPLVEVARRMGVTANHAYNIHHRALKKLKGMLEEVDV